MTVGDSPFPLLRLPSLLFRHVARYMENIDRLALSYVSNRTKSLVISIDLKCTEVMIQIEEAIIVRIDFPSYDNLICTFEDCPENGESKVHRLRDTREGFTFHKPEYRLEDSLSHIFEIYHQPNIVTVSIGRLLPDMEEFRRCIKSFSGLYISRDLTDIETWNILKTFKPEKRLFLDHIPFGNDKGMFHEFLIQNLEAIELRWNNIPLDCLLITNSEFIKIITPKINEKVLNRFIKHWINGSNPRLKHLELWCPKSLSEINLSVVLKGIRHQEIPETYRRSFKGLECTIHVDGGYDIRRKDGTVATVWSYDQENFDFFVWI
ncbi:CRE-FBXB-106 protein [Caenorhabditis remanei]|uniref:CRE-FBXB-106 protein n=1 Tax=Caenorhabditis remanei TaxID=31234 RepID=E3MG07_CAERE|nr:CRE-FBXB-106 protein [Caenorhabditis remanei]